MSDVIHEQPPQGSEPAQDPVTPDPETRRRAAVVLEVLGGAKSPPEAAAALGVTLATYYLLEARALEGLVAACEPRPRGRGGSRASTLEAVRRENERLRHELTRAQSLARAVQRAAGTPAEDAASDARPRRRRRRRSRALKAAQELLSSGASDEKTRETRGAVPDGPASHPEA